MAKFDCPICDGKDFHDCGEMHEDKTLLVCKKCGAVWHDRDNAKEEEMLAFYRNDYRSQPDHKNLVFSQNKLNYISEFLRDYLEGKKGLVCTDIGCATGYLAHFLRRLGHRATGTEYTTTFRRFAEHFYGILTTERIEKKHKYDLITFYHTLEHMMKPDEKLREARECLAENGRIMVSVPRFLHIYDDPSTMSIVPFDKYYHKNHINLFTLQAIKNLFAKVGLKVVKENLVTYGMTFLLEKCDPMPIKPEDWHGNFSMLDLHKRTWELCKEGRFKDAINLFPLIPAAWIAYITQTIGKDPARQYDEWQNCLAHPEMVKDTKVLMAYSMWLQQNERYEEAVEWYDKLIAIKANSDWFFNKGVCYTILKKHDLARDAFMRSSNMQPLRWAECADWACKNVCALPHWEERAVAQVKEEMLAMNKDRLVLAPRDKVMDGHP